MTHDERPEKPGGTEKQGFLSSLLQGLIRDTISLGIAFVIGTGAAAVVCLYFGVPLVASLVGGILVLGIYVAWSNL